MAIISMSKKQAKNQKRFLKDVRNELKKVTWTSKEKVLQYTKIVLLSVVFFGMMIYGVDLVIKHSLEWISSLFGAKSL